MWGASQLLFELLLPIRQSSLPAPHHRLLGVLASRSRRWSSLCYGWAEEDDRLFTLRWSKEASFVSG